MPKQASERQSDKLKKAAREVEMEDRKEAFDALVKRIAQAPSAKD